MASTARKSLPNCRCVAKVLSGNRQPKRFNLTDDSHISADPTQVLTTKRGFPVYRSNPSVPERLPTRAKRIQVPGGNGAMIVNGTTGEVIGKAGIGFWVDEEVDKGRFVKLFLDGIKQAAGLSKAGVQVFELVYNQVREHPGTDRIELNLFMAQDHDMELSERTYQRGVRELLEKQFLFRSPSEGVFFVNIGYMFNGDRLAFVKTYHLKNSGTQRDLPFAIPPALPAPVDEES